MTTAPGVLELLLPSASARRILVLGDGTPPGLLPARRDGTGPADLAIVAPTAEELRRSGWLESALDRAAGELAPEGTVFVLVPPHARGRATRLLAATGLVGAEALLHLPGWAGDGGIVPLEPNALRAQLGTLIPLAYPRRRLWAAITRLPGAGAMLSRMHPSVTLAARAAPATPPARWALDAAGGGSRVALRVKHRGARGSIVIVSLAPDGRAQGVLKVATIGREVDETRLVRTAERIRCLGPGARAAGARVPEARAVRGCAGFTALAESVVPGVPASTRLEGGQVRPDHVVRRLAGWLERWHETTVVERILDRERLELEVLVPAAAVAAALADGARYCSWLEERCRALAGSRVRLVAVHGDLTMSNVLLEDEEPPGIVDWEMASSEGLPFRDLWYAAADAEAAPDRYRDRPGGFDRSRDGGSRTGRIVADTTARIRDRLALSPEFVTLCLHACWLQHAADEQAKRGPGEARPFLQIVRRLARGMAA